MFTKYNGIDVPKNYSGSRFKQAMEMEMKTHRADGVQMSTPIKKSSPPQSFQSVIDKAAEGMDASTLSYTSESVEEQEDTDEIIDPVSIIEEKTEELAPASMTSSTDIGLGSLLDSLSGDDILLISLILLLTGNEGFENKELIVTLALLLLYR